MNPAESNQLTDGRADLVHTPPSLVAETALARIATIVKNPDATVEDIASTASIALTTIDMHRRLRRGRDGRRTWLARVTSPCFPRTFATDGPAPDIDPAAQTVDELLSTTAEWGKRHHHACFTIEVTDGGKNLTGRTIEVQIPADEAEHLGKQMLRVAAFQRNGGTR